MLNINKEQYLNRFQIIQSPRLDLKDEHGNEYINNDWSLIKQGICPICLCNLKVSLKGDIFCNSKRHQKITRKKLFITNDSLGKFK